jgi:hypothetical protein
MWAKFPHLARLRIVAPFFVVEIHVVDLTAGAN